MFIRRTKTNNSITGEAYFTFRLVQGERRGGRVCQITLLNLGRHFNVKQDDWPLLCSRIEQLLSPQNHLVEIECPALLEREAQRCYAKLIARPANTEVTSLEGSLAAATEQVPVTVQAPDFQEVDINSLQQSQPRSTGVEHAGLHALSEIGFIKKLDEVGIDGPMQSSIIANVIGRMAKPASELSTWNWLLNQSALPELLDCDFERMSHNRLYQASDLLMKNREAIEDHIFSSVKTLFTLGETVTLYDLTNTYFEGDACDNPKAERGHSKEKRSDCPLVTLGLVLDGSGFVRRSKNFAGNVAECITLEKMLEGLNAPKGALVIMDCGIATEANIAWLVEHGYRYLVVNRSRSRQFDETKAINIETAGGDTLRIQKELSEDGKEVLLYCHSPGREMKERGMVERFSKGFEAGLQKIVDGLARPRGEKHVNKLLERIGRLKQKSRGASQHYKVDLIADESGKKACGLTWKKVQVEGTMATHPGVYCLRSSEIDWNEEKLWRTYTMLTDLESVFRSLKSELGLRPIFHRKENRVDGHLFITVLAYQAVQMIHTKLKAAGVNQSWSGLRDVLAVQQRVTASFRLRDGRTTHIRKSTVAEPALKEIYKALGINSAPGGTKKSTY